MKVKDLVKGIEEATASEVAKLVAELAAMQEKRRKVLDDAFYADENMATQEYALTDKIKKLTMAGKLPPGEVAVEIHKQRVAVGEEFDSRFVDWMAAKGAAIYPEKYAVQRSKAVFSER